MQQKYVSWKTDRKCYVDHQTSGWSAWMLNNTWMKGKTARRWARDELKHIESVWQHSRIQASRLTGQNKHIMSLPTRSAAFRKHSTPLSASWLSSCWATLTNTSWESHQGETTRADSTRLCVTLFTIQNKTRVTIHTAEIRYAAV